MAPMTPLVRLLTAPLLTALLVLPASGPGSATGAAGAAGATAGTPTGGIQAAGGFQAVAASSEGPRRFWVRDRHRYSSPWYAGARRKMIGFGCTRAPYYAPDPRCTGERGFHHGIDIAMPCGTRLFAGLPGRVVDPSSAGALGPSYGANAFRIRNRRHAVDIVVGHVRRVYVAPGDRVRTGQLVARASDAGAPDGCHLHFEVRPARAGYQDAIRPHEHLRLRR